jgi:acyl carrier protein
MDRRQLQKVLLDIIEADRGEAPTEFGESSSLREDVGLDSVDVVTMVMGIESRLKIQLATEELTNLQTVGDLLDLIQAKLATPPQAKAG